MLGSVLQLSAPPVRRPGKMTFPLPFSTFEMQECLVLCPHTVFSVAPPGLCSLLSGVWCAPAMPLSKLLLFSLLMTATSSLVSVGLISKPLIGNMQYNYCVLILPLHSAGSANPGVTLSPPACYSWAPAACTRLLQLPHCSLGLR